MLTTIAVTLAPFFLNLVMAGAKWLGRLENTQEKRGVLALLSILGAVVYNAYSGEPLDPTSISELITVALESFVAFVLSHGTYSLFFNKKKRPDDLTEALQA